MQLRRGSGFALALGLAGSPAAAVDVCPESCSVQVDFACTFTGDYRRGEPKDVVTITPGPGGETLAENGITIRVWLRDCAGRPLVGVPADSVFLSAPYVCACVPGGTAADSPTDSLGYTTFTGALRAGGCADPLYLVAGCTIIGAVPVKTNSPDVVFAEACKVSLDESNVIRNMLNQGLYYICLDLNEDGHVDGADYAQIISRYWGHRCTWRRPPCPGSEVLPWVNR